MINIADRLKAVSSSPERVTDDRSAPDSTRLTTDPGPVVRVYPAKNLVLENGQYRVVDHEK